MISTSTSRITSWLFLGIWLLIFLLGLSLYAGISRQQVSGYPNAGQFKLYLLLPGTLLLANACAVLFLKKFPAPLAVMFAVMQIIAVIAFIFLAGGGI